MTTPKQWRRAWLHKANDNYYTDEKMKEELQKDARIAGSYFEVIEVGALTEEQENTRFYKKEWESACERAAYAKELEAEIEKLHVIGNSVTRCYQKLFAESELLKAQGHAQTNIDLSVHVSDLLHRNAELREENEQYRKTIKLQGETVELRERQLEQIKHIKWRWGCGDHDDKDALYKVWAIIDQNIEEMK